MGGWIGKEPDTRCTHHVTRLARQRARHIGKPNLPKTLDPVPAQTEKLQSTHMGKNLLPNLDKTLAPVPAHPETPQNPRNMSIGFCKRKRS